MRNRKIPRRRNQGKGVSMVTAAEVGVQVRSITQMASLYIGTDKVDIAADATFGNVVRIDVNGHDVTTFMQTIGRMDWAAEQFQKAVAG